MKEIRVWAAAFFASVGYVVWLFGSIAELIVHLVVQKSIQYLGMITHKLDNETGVMVAIMMLKTVDMIQKWITGKGAKEI